MPSSSPRDQEQEFIARLRAILKATNEFPEPPPETVARAKALFRQQPKKQPTRRWRYILALIVLLVIVVGVVLIFIHSSAL